jgi:response regulator RpfG family c-di-GMP phosphodiesterase
VLRLDDEEVRTIACGALLHEIGKLEIPESILRKPAVLTAEERLIMRGYCQCGYEIVRREASLQDAAEIVRPHRGAYAFAAARAEIQHWAGRQFDPRIVEAFSNVPDEDLQMASSNL